MHKMNKMTSTKDWEEVQSRDFVKLENYNLSAPVISGGQFISFGPFSFVSGFGTIRQLKKDGWVLTGVQKQPKKNRVWKRDIFGHRVVRYRHRDLLVAAAEMLREETRMWETRINMGDILIDQWMSDDYERSQKITALLEEHLEEKK